MGIGGIHHGAFFYKMTNHDRECINTLGLPLTSRMNHFANGDQLIPWPFEISLEYGKNENASFASLSGCFFLIA
jgi:hypothetical protein